MNPEPRETMMLFAREELGLARSPEFISWATQALVDGFDSPGLRRLAGMDLARPTEVRGEEVANAFQQTLREIGVSAPSRDVALRWYLRVLAARICSGELKPREGLDQIHLEVVNALGHPQDLRDWCALWSMDPNESQEITESAIEAEVLRAAAELLSSKDDSDRLP